MALLRISLLGHFEVHCAIRETSIKVPRASQTLLAYLLLQRHRNCPRDLLAGLFWGDHTDDKARRCLNSALWRLRRVLEPESSEKGSSLFVTSTGEIGFNWESDHWLDVAVFEKKVGRILAKPLEALEETDAETLCEMLRLYKGDLLEGFYEDWALRERERVRRLFMNSLARLMRYYRDQGAFEDGLACGKRILAHDPLREEIHREVMRLFLMNGQRALALRQYQRCCEVLAAELGIGPMEETQALHERIVKTTADQPEHLGPSGASKAGGREAVEQLRLAMKGFDRAREQLHRAIKLVDQLSVEQDKNKASPR